MYKYGISTEDYDALFAKQNGCCAICEIHQSDLRQTLSVDHDHKSGKVRGLLCNDCNVGLGFFDDNVATINAAIDYLRMEDELRHKRN